MVHLFPSWGWQVGVAPQNSTLCPCPFATWLLPRHPYSPQNCVIQGGMVWPFQAGRWDGVSPLAEDGGSWVREAIASQQSHQAWRDQNLPTGVGN